MSGWSPPVPWLLRRQQLLWLTVRQPSRKRSRRSRVRKLDDEWEKYRAQQKKLEETDDLPELELDRSILACEQVRERPLARRERSRAVWRESVHVRAADSDWPPPFSVLAKVVMY